MTMASGKLEKCITPTPKTTSAADTMTAYSKAAELGKWITIFDPIDWTFALSEKPATESRIYEAALWQTFLVKAHKLNLMLQIDPYGVPRTGTIGSKLPATSRDLTFAHPWLRNCYTCEVLRRVAWYRPVMLCLAMEANSFTVENPNDRNNFVSLLEETIKTVKAKFGSSAPIMFASIQWEQALETDTRYLNELVELSDVIGLSSYPHIRYESPQAVPENYYRGMATTYKPLVFAELGWPSSQEVNGGSDSAQAAFIRRLPKLLSGINTGPINWITLHDGYYGVPFDSMGLCRKDGTAKPALKAWRGL